jgi:predicted enzyme related to lactoylglutathione lyase
MSTREEPWLDGTPCWADLTSTDPESLYSFYAGLFGWRIEVTKPERGGYAMGLLGRRPVAGIGQAPPVSGTAAAAWTTYLATDDAAKSCDLIDSYGGTVLMAPRDIGTEGRLALAADPGGAVFGLWQARNHIGAQRVNEPGAMCWNECMTYDAAAAREFYTMVFSYRYGGMAHDLYTLIARPSEDVGPETAIGGIGQLDPAWAGRIPAHWMTYFAVADVDAATGKVTRGGGQVLGGPRDTPYGRTAVCEDPQGAVFSIITLPVTS